MTIDVHSDVLMTARSVRSEYDLDLITAEAIRAGLIEVTRHMRDSLVRSAYSNTIRDILDFGVAIHHVGAEGSEMSAITEGCCHFAFTHQHMTNMVMDEWGYENLGPGDTIFCNDSWRGAIHFPDVNLFRPIFWKDEPIFVLTDATHIMDIGGPVPGGFNAAAAGQFRSGFANTLIMEVTSDMTQATILLDAGRFPRPGLASGGSGMTSYLYRVKPQPGNIIRQRNGIIPLSDLEPLAGKVDADGAPDSGGGQWCVDTELQTLKLTGLPLRKGDILYLICATGGGYGDPLERDPERVRADVWNERISPEFARDAYGVVITDGEVDARATTELRAGYRADGWVVPVAGPRRWPRTWEEMT